MNPRTAARLRARLGAMGVGGCVGAVLCVVLWGQALSEVWAVHEALAQMPDPQAPAMSMPLAAASLAPGWDGPALGESDAAWLWLQQRLQAQGLRLQALRPEAVQSGAVLASQLAHLRVQGAWADWTVWGQQLLHHAPWWTWEQWQVQPFDGSGQVQVDARLRLWLGPAQTVARPWAWPVWPVPAVPAALVPGEAIASASSPAWRLWGTWTQAGQTHAVRGHGADWTLQPWPGGTP